MFLRQEGYPKIDLFAIHLFDIYLGIRQGTAGHQLGCGALAMIATKDKVDAVDKSAHRTNTCGPFHLIDPGIRHGNVRPSYSTLALIATMADENTGPDSQLDSKFELQEPPPKKQSARASPGCTAPPSYTRPPGYANDTHQRGCKDLATGPSRHGRTNNEPGLSPLPLQAEDNPQPGHKLTRSSSSRMPPSYIKPARRVAAN